MFNVNPYNINVFKSFFSKLNINSFLTTTGKTLNVINQIIPIYKQVKPMINNVKTIYNIINTPDDNTKNIKQNLNTKNNYHIKKENTGPTFFI